MIASVIDCSYGVTDMRYSELVQAIKSNTLAALVTLLEGKALARFSGTTRDAYMFDTHVVKVNNCSVDHNIKEYTHYCNFKTGLLNIPIVQTRMYKTTDGKTVLIQERLLKIFAYYAVGGNSDLYTEIKGDDGDMQDQLHNSGVPWKAFDDGLQCGYNKRNQVVFFDYSRSLGE